MKQFLKKPLGLAVAATMAMGGMAVYTNASAATDITNTGDLALVPYYTVKGNYSTGIHITNSSAETQVVKMRLRRAGDSADVLDFNLVMSPEDMWTGTLSKQADGTVAWVTTDNTCLVPKGTVSTLSNGKTQSVLPSPFTGDDTIEEGYIEIIGMATAADENQNIAVDALHAQPSGIPADCDAVRSNFFTASVTNNATTIETDGFGAASVPAVTNAYKDVDGHALKVQYFIRDTTTGMEMGGNATHIVDFAAAPMMTNQQTGLVNGNYEGADFPDLDGGGANGGNGATRGAGTGLYDTVIRPNLGAASIFNDWSYNIANKVKTDWVVTVPGQYLMDDPAMTAVNNRDLPLTAGLQIWDREEGLDAVATNPGELIISPPPADPDAEPALMFPYETNVVEWGGQSLFESSYVSAKVTPGLARTTGWSNLTLTPDTTSTQLIFDLTDPTAAGVPPTNVTPPVIAFTAWQRGFDDVNKNYGHIVDHSRVQ